MRDYSELHDPEDADEAGDGRPRLKGKHTERECRYYRDEMARREAHYRALGVGREYDLLMAATRRRLPGPPRTALPGRIPEDRRLPAPDDDSRLLSSEEEEADDIA